MGLYLELQNLPIRVPHEPSANISEVVPTHPYEYSPFSPITVKQLMLTSTVQVRNHPFNLQLSKHLFKFLDEPLAYLTVYYTNVAFYISPNGMSFIGVIVAALSARFLMKDDLRYRQFGVLLFAVSFNINHHHIVRDIVF